MSVLRTIYDYYNMNDPRTSEWFLISSPGTVIAIISFYLYFCISLGPTFMKYREPYSLRTTLIIYNLIQVLLSVYLVCEGLMSGWLFGESWRCRPVDYSDQPFAMREARGMHLYFVCKLFELLDTVFFVLRKKDRQISFLHLYHHGGLPLCAWFGVRYVPGGHPILIGIINSFIHIIMYTYYLLSALGPEVQKYLWWKKHLTMLQIIQFTIICVYSGQLLFIDCDFPKWIAVFLVLGSGTFIYQFGAFYIENNMKKSVRTSESDNVSTDNRTSVKSD